MRTTHLLAGALLSAVSVPSQAIELSGIGGARLDVPVASLQQLRFRSTLRQQFDFSCGSAAVATLLTHHYGHPVTEQLVFEQMYLRGNQPKIRKEGFSLLDMQGYLARLGYRADGFQQPLDKLVQAGLPAIVLVTEKGYQHFVVVKGLSAERVLIGDPAAGTRAMTRARFEAIWPSKLLFVIHSRTSIVGSHARATGPSSMHKQAAFNRPEDWRVAPQFQLRDALGDGAANSSLAGLTLAKHGPGDF